MRTNFSILLAVVSITLLAPPIAADTPPESAPEAADDAELSAIDGQLVPAGRHNEYRHDHPRWNLASNPIGWLFGLYGASLSFAPNERVAVRGDANYFDLPDDEETGYELNAGVQIFFRHSYQGPFLEPGLMARSYSNTTFGPQVLGGWQWRFDSGLNAAVAFGVGRDLNRDDGEFADSTFPNGYLRFGYAF